MVRLIIYGIAMVIWGIILEDAFKPVVIMFMILILSELISIRDKIIEK